jgi:(2Fe-2S) ferredoxin/SAM-dependent methyltransferase
VNLPPFRHHVFVCEQQKPDGLPCCAARGSAAVLETLRREVAAAGLADSVAVTSCGSLGLCESGPNLVVYPEGVFYSGVRPDDVPELVREHLTNDRPLARLARTDEAALRAEVATNRRRMLEGLKAREAAGAVPDELLRTIRGFQESRVLLTALELDVFTAVAAGATADDVAAARALDPRGATLLLNALAALGLLAKQDGRFRNMPCAARYLCAGSPDDARAALRHHVSLWSRWSTLTEAVRAGHAASLAEGPPRGDDWTTPFIAAMHRNAVLRAPLVVQAVGSARRLLDVGGGSGAYAIAFAQANPDLLADVVDLPSVLPLTRKYLAEAGLASRAHTREGDLRRDDLGAGYDLVLLSAICHMLSPAENQDLLRRARTALAPGGRVVIQDFVVAEDGTAPLHAALFALNMLVGTAGGQTYSASQYLAWLRAAGCSDARVLSLPGPTDLVIGACPA